MASVDMKILFGVDIKDSDFERVNKELQRIQDNAKRLNDSLGQYSSVGTSGFQKMMDSITGMGKITDAIKNINNLSSSIETLTKSKDGLSGLVRSMSDLGRSINDSMGETKTRLMRQYNVELSSLRASADSKIHQSQLANDMAARAEASGNFERAGRYRGISSRLGMESAQAYDTYMNHAYWQPISSGLRMGGAVAGGIIGASSAYQNLFEFGPARSFAAEQSLRFQQASAAARGDVTSQILSSLGIGLEHAGKTNMGSMVMDQLGIAGQFLGGATNFGRGFAGAMAGGAMGGPLGALIGGLGGLFSPLATGEYKTWGELEAKRAAQRRSLDSDVYGPLFRSAGDLQLDRNQRFDSLYRQFGFNRTQSMLLGNNNMGISDEMMDPVAAMTVSMGLNPGRTLGLSLMGQQLGLSGNMFEQMIRLTSRDPNARGTIRNIMAMTGVETLGGAEAVSNIMGGVMQSQVGNFTAGGALGFIAAGSRAAIAATPGLPEPEVATVGARVAGGIQGMAGQAGSFVSMGMDMAMVNLGVDDSITRIKAAELWAQNPAQAVQLVSSYLKRHGRPVPEEKIRAALSGVTTQFMSVIKDVTSRGSEAFGDVGISLGASLVLGGLQTGSADTMDRIADSAGELGGTDVAGGRAAPSFGGPKLEIQAAQAARQAAIIEGVQKVTGDLGRSILNEIATGFRMIGTNISGLADKAKEELDKNAGQVTGTSKKAGGS